MHISSLKKARLFMAFFHLFPVFIFSQNQKLADSLIILYENESYNDGGLALLKNIAEEETDPERQLKFSELLIKKASKDSLFGFLHSGFLQKGNAMQAKGNNALALESYFKSLDYAYRLKHEAGIGGLLLSIAGTYSAMKNSKVAQGYYNKSIKILRKLNDSVNVATALLNAGDDYFSVGKLDSTILYTTESVLIFNKLNMPIGEAYGLGNLGMVYAEQGKDVLAENFIYRAIEILEINKDYYPISVYLNFMADIYLRKKDFPSALKYGHRALSLAEQYQLKEQISEANLKLSELYEIIGNLEISYRHYKEHIAYRDSVINLQKVQQIGNMRTDYEVSQKQVEVVLLETQKRNQLIILGFIGILLLASLWFYRIISKEKIKSEKLLLNILPADTAKELKLNGKVKARKYNAVTVMFTDFKGFTSFSENLSPEALVETVDFYFSKFDTIIEKHGLEKIKTIGDAYMCAGGLHHNEDNHAKSTVEAAFEIAAFVEQTKNDTASSELAFDIRIGINTGPVVAGVVGTKKFAYDIWGDTVNVAARMETMSEAGRINISENTYKLVKEEYDCEPRGEIQVKNRGMMQMYFVNAL
ncbi:MAG: adenylate cyclase [Sediminicola sp.]|jgi:adenylate cyclase